MSDFSTGKAIRIIVSDAPRLDGKRRKCMKQLHVYVDPTEQRL